MQLAALLPKPSAEHVQLMLPGTSIVFANSWDDLAQLLRTGAFSSALIDPQVGGDNTDTALRIINQHPRTPIFAYVELTASSFRDILVLSRHGLKDAFVHPVRRGDKRLVNAIEKAGGDERRPTSSPPLKANCEYY